MADHLLEHGLSASGLRALAHSAGTSDRMLLYYFNDKDDLLAAVFRHLGERLHSMLEDNAPVERVDSETLLEIMWSQSQNAQFTTYTSLLLEMGAAAIRKGEPYSGAARAIAAHFQDWIEARLALESASERKVAAYRIMAMLDGLALLQAFGLERP